MPVLTTPRLVLLPLTRRMLERRLADPPFDLSLDLPGGTADVHFPESWPGDPLPGFPGMLAQLAAGVDEVEGSFVAVDVGNRVVVGQLGAVGPLGDDGAQEIGYGFNPEVWGRGFATESVVALTAHLLTLAGVATVVADTATWNVASSRVLEKAGFARTGTSWSEDDGDLFTWRHAPGVSASSP